MEEEFHTPVLLKEAIDCLRIKPGEKYIDATVGGGGHAWEIVKRGGILLGLDVDPEALLFFIEKLEAPPSDFHPPTSAINLVQINFKDIDKIAKELAFEPVSGILFDLGMSSYQIERSGRGFSFKKEEPLDMRMDPELKVTASDLVNALSRRELYELFSRLGEEALAGLYSSAIYRARRVKPINTAKELAEIIYRVYRRRRVGEPRIHPATRVFQALRIAVNDEINNLKVALPRAVGLLKTSGRLVVISFHSLEDREVKGLAQRPDLRVVERLIRPRESEVEKNPRSKGAKMRVFEKI